MIRVVLPHHLRTLAHVGDEIHVDPDGSMTVRTIIDAIEEKYPMLRGTIRDHETQKRRPLVRFFACGEDISHEPPIPPCPIRLQKAPSRFSSWARSRADKRASDDNQTDKFRSTISPRCRNRRFL